jgi:threonyl-tRNA synthetase
MNCPHHCEIYKTEPRSYRDLPVRLAEFGTGVPLRAERRAARPDARARLYQDDAHIFCRPDQVKDEFKKVIDIVLYVLKALDFPRLHGPISLRDPENKTKYIGSDENWSGQKPANQEAAAEIGLNTEPSWGDAAIYGAPKLDFM